MSKVRHDVQSIHEVNTQLTHNVATTLHLRGGPFDTQGGGGGFVNFRKTNFVA